MHEKGKDKRMKKPVFALIDCNNFFVSCERIFRPDLEGKPVIVLSSNDGCAVARSNEAKALGIPMAAPAFKYRDVIRRNNVIQFSANFELYGDVSKRIVDILTTVTPRIEVYSVDESFLELSNLPIEDYVAWGHKVRELILKWVGVPVSIGIAPSKALAKLASDRGKKLPGLGGVCSFVGPNAESPSSHMQRVMVSDIWGIGWRLAPKFKGEGIMTAWDFACMRPRHAQAIMGIHGRQLIAELNGTSCWPLEQVGKVRKSIMSTRTFGEDTGEFNVIEAAIASFAANAAFKLRRSGQLTTKAALFITTDKHKPGYRRLGQEIRFEVPTADTGLLASALAHGLKEIFQPQMGYHRAGVLLYDFVPAAYVQTDFFGSFSHSKHDESTQRMDVIDAINQRFGKRTIKFAAEDLAAKWQPKHNLRSPRYVSHWAELPIIK
jgi:DNA polymerase V